MQTLGNIVFWTAIALAVVWIVVMIASLIIGADE